ncbi:alpha-mannosidase [Paenibacillus sp. LMG 31458]|uniref:Alpha-mannosidase n=1 Tax=Paenibacillus phytorum TaxID=2654977 RepID=A0ABX1XYC2_9BACL|nr:glycoside hydrolase family 38 C-terminal domain-containing protein [Paenibacillus phytorum]NOU73552.1 alpha-mannosidase [Paenibacillus phytorum]
MHFVVERTRMICKELLHLSVSKRLSPENITMKEGFYLTPEEANQASSPWVSFDPQIDMWGGFDTNCWFRAEVNVPKEVQDKDLALYFKTSNSGWDQSNPQFLLFLDNQPVQGLDMNHREIMLDKNKSSFTIDLQAYTSRVSTDKMHLYIELGVVEKEILALYYDIFVLSQVIEELNPDEKPRVDLELAITDTINLIDLRKPYSDKFYDSIRSASEYINRVVYTEMAGNDAVIATCVGHTHIDVAWKWTVEQTRQKTGRSFATELKLMEEYPDFKFMSSQPQLYKFLKQWYPDMYAKVKERVAEGRWEAEGSMWLEADCNLISGESMVRQILYGKKFFKDEFGIENYTLWLPDVFGYSAAMPQIMKKSGIKYFMTTKIAWNEFNQLPYDTFWWKGIDGSEIFTHLITTRDVRNPKGANMTTYNGYLEPRAVMGAWDRYQQKGLNNDVLVSFGHGDGGGGATREMIETGIRLEKGLPGVPKVRFDTTTKYFDELYDRVAENSRLPKWVGELYLEFHRGTYTSMARNKRSNRELEVKLQDLEFLALWAEKYGMEYPQTLLDELWETMLLNQFHDVIPGCSIKEVYDVTRLEYQEIEMKANEMIDKAKTIIAANTASDKGLVVFNTLSFDRDDLVILEKNNDFASLQYQDGELIQLQDTYDGKTAALVKSIPGKGLKNLALSDKVAANANPFTFNGFEISTPYATIKFNENGFIDSLFDRVANREVQSEGTMGNVLKVYEDKPFKNDNWNIDIYYKEKSWLCDEVVKMEWVEKGPIRSVLYIEKLFSDSLIKQYVMFYAHSPRIDFETTVDWKENQCLLRVDFPVEINAYEATYDIQFGNTKRPTHFNTSWDVARFEVCAHKWADISESGYGVSLLNDCKYGYSIHHGVMSLTLIKSGIFPNPVADREFHRFTYSILPHENDWKDADTVSEAWKLNQPLHVAYTDGKQASHGNERMLTIIGDNVIGETFKKSMAGNSAILRLHEFKNMRNTIKMNVPYTKVYETDLMENRIGEIPVVDGEINLEILPFEIKTLELI